MNNLLVEASMRSGCPASQQRGHIIVYKDDSWRYEDTMEPAGFENDRSCKKCGLCATPEGYDGCLGYLEGAENACCGHGINEGYVMINGQTIKLQDWMNEKETGGNE